MKLERIQTIEIDLTEERKRLRESLTGEQLERHLHLTLLFEQEKWKEFEKAYDALPYDDEEGCTEAEFVGNYTGYVWSMIYNKSQDPMKDFTGVVTTHPSEFKVIKEKTFRRECPGCGNMIDVKDQIHQAGCGWTWGRRGWRQLGAYDG